MKNYLLILIATLIFQVSAQFMPEKFNDFYTELMISEPKQRAKKLDNAIKKEPNEPWYYWMAAEFQAIMGDDLQAQKSYEKAISVDPKFSGGYASLARFLVYKDSTQLDNALFHINKALQIEPNNGQYYVDRGSIYLELKEYDKAMRDAKSASTLNADVIAVAHLKIKILHQASNKEELYQFVKQNDLSEEGSAFGTDFMLMLASVYEEMGEKDTACKLYRYTSEEYAMFDDDIPSHIAEKLKKCQ
jgi:tetratricopeptide (TPR) repeat protein